MGALRPPYTLKPKVSRTPGVIVAISQTMVGWLLVAAAVLTVVIGLASPWLASRVFRTPGSRPNRDVVLVIDGSYSMGAEATGRSAHEAAKEWALAYLSELRPGDHVAVLQAKQLRFRKNADPGVAEEAEEFSPRTDVATADTAGLTPEDEAIDRPGPTAPIELPAEEAAEEEDAPKPRKKFPFQLRGGK